MSDLRVAVIPAAGRAVRLNGLPKFLLPIDASLSLLSYHLKMASEYADITIIGTRPEFSSLVLEISKDFRAKTCVVDTKTLTETVCEITRGLAPRTLTVHLPDTHVGDENIFAKLEKATLSKEKSGLALWRSSESQRGHLGQVKIESSGKDFKVVQIVDKDPEFFTGYHWGAISFFRPDLESWSRTEPTIGNIAANLIQQGEEFFSILSDSSYVDLGTIANLRDFYAQGN